MIHTVRKTTTIHKIWLNQYCNKIWTNMQTFSAAMISHKVLSTEMARMILKLKYAKVTRMLFTRQALKIKKASNCSLSIRMITNKESVFPNVKTWIKPATALVFPMVITQSANKNMSIEKWLVFHPKKCWSKISSNSPFVVHVQCIRRKWNHN